jgi:outer membrane protein assembly factor BamB
MTIDNSHAPSKNEVVAAKAASTATIHPPRLWPALLLIAAYWIAWGTVNLFCPGTFTQFLTIFWSPFVLTIGILVWWLGFSRQPWADRLWGVGCLIAGGIGAYFAVHSSMKMGLIMYATPVAITAVVLCLLALRNAATTTRWISIAAASLLAWHYFSLIRVDGITGNLKAERSWRWNPTAEDKFLEERKALVKPAASAGSETPVLVATAADWPEFRGVLRDGHVRNVQLATDWSAHPPREVWRHRVGPAWSSFAVVGNRAFTQEQRGEQEAVLCVNLATGQEIWSHEDKRRFYEVVGGAGPRATPTFDQNKIYALGGDGILNCLDAATGKLIWSQDIAKDGETKLPPWGFSSSPLVVQGIVTVFAGGKGGRGIVAYDAATGKSSWSAGQGQHSYSSPHLVKVGDTSQILMESDYGLEAFDPETGKLLWDHKWYLDGVFRVCQPLVVHDTQVLLGTGMSYGTRLLDIAGGSVAESWTSKDLKPYFNDFVYHDEHLYGFDGDVMTCVELATGKKKWKKGRYGHGQALLVGDRGQLVIISDKGEAILAEISPSGLTERGKFQAVTGKTWNHPVIAAGKLLIRNGEEMACYDLGPAKLIE